MNTPTTTDCPHCKVEALTAERDAAREAVL